MRLVIQRVKNASVTVNNQLVNQIEQGFLVLWGACKGDTEKEADYMAKKLSNLRVFEDENEKMNLSLNDIMLMVTIQRKKYRQIQKRLIRKTQ